MGFTITELVVAAAIGLLTASVAGQALVSHLESSERAEAMERQRNDWARTTHFIESEIALSERLIRTIDNIIVPSSCDIKDGEFRLAIDMRRDLPIVIYAVKQSTLNWLPENTLWRCGPGLRNNGSYKNSIEFERLLDGLDGTVDEGGGFISSSNTSNSSKYADFILALKGHATVKYGQVTAARSRISPLYTRPTVNSLCDASNMVKVKGTSGPDTDLSAENISVLRGEDILLCGYGGGDSITGSSANDIIEAGDTGSSTLTGAAGNDVLRGTNDADTLFGGPGNDVLVGRGGNDKLVGDLEAQDIGDDQNIYLPGNGNDTIQGGQGLDIIFFSGNQGEYIIVGTTESPCNTESCTVETSEGETKSIYDSEILIFNDARLDLPDP